MTTFSRRIDWVKRNRAFIAAPLLGTIIFLACVIFIINLNKIESANVVLAEGDAYHNRMVSLLEMYRSDVASMFRQQLTFLTENYLASQCWVNLFDIKNSKPSGDNPSYDNAIIQRLPEPYGYAGIAPEEKDYTMAELRYAKCKYVNYIINSMGRSVISCKTRCLPESQGGPCKPPCTDQTSCMNPDNGCATCQECMNKLYGLSKILGDLSHDKTFEGIDFKVSNLNEFKFVLESDTAVNTRAEQFTGTLLGGSLFDCGAFAKDGKLQCCSVSGDMLSDTSTGTGHKEYEYDMMNSCGERQGRLISDTSTPVTGDVVPGCEDGSFFMKISMQNSIVFPVMPRFSADDAVGNQLRTGALGDSDFNIPISYPLYRYLNYAFQVYEDLANGGPGSSGDKDNGIAQGLCAQSPADSSSNGNTFEGDCSYETPFYHDVGYTPSEPCTDANSCEDAVLKAFVTNRLKNSCDKFNDVHGGVASSEPAAIYVCSGYDQGSGGDSGACTVDKDSWSTLCGGSNPGDDNPRTPVNLFDSTDPTNQLFAGSNNQKTLFTNNTCSRDISSSLPSSQHAYCSFIDGVGLWLRFNDLSEEHRVNPSAQNRLCANIYIQHYPKPLTSGT